MKKDNLKKNVKKITVKKTAVTGKKVSQVKNKKPAAGKNPAAGKASKPTAKPAVKSVKKSKKAQTTKKPAEKKVVTAIPEPRPAPTLSLQDLNLPDGNDYKQTAHRRPLIVFPK